MLGDLAIVCIAAISFGVSMMGEPRSLQERCSGCWANFPIPIRSGCTKRPEYMYTEKHQFPTSWTGGKRQQKEPSPWPEHTPAITKHNNGRSPLFSPGSCTRISRSPSTPVSEHYTPRCLKSTWVEASTVPTPLLCGWVLVKSDFDLSLKYRSNKNPDRPATRNTETASSEAIKSTKESL